MEAKPKIGVLGTGDFGCAIAKRLIQSDYDVVVGSRNPEKRNLTSRDKVLANAKLASIGECLQSTPITIVAIPCKNIDFLKNFEDVLTDKILVDVSNPTKKPKDKSNAEKLQELLPSTRVVKCFNTVSAYTMGDDSSNEHRQVYIASDDQNAVESVSQLARDMGFTSNNAGRLQKARELEAEPLYLFSGWGWPTLFTAGVFLLEVLYLVLVMYVFVDRYDVSQIPTYLMYKACGAVSVNLLAFCYLPGIFAAFAQIYYGSKHTRFQAWLDMWLKGRKQLGIYSLMFAFLHMIAVMSCMNGDYFSYLFNKQHVTVKFNATEDTVIDVDTKMNLHGEGCIISGLIAITTMGVIGLTSVPAIGALMNWREWRFIQSQFGFVCFLLTVGHCMVHGVPRWIIQKHELPLRNSFMSLIFPWFTLLLKIIYFFPCIHIYVWKIRRGYERGVRYDLEKGKAAECAAYTNKGYTPENNVCDDFSTDDSGLSTKENSSISSGSSERSCEDTQTSKM